jgi:hypothetical protein
MRGFQFGMVGALGRAGFLDGTRILGGNESFEQE